MRAEPGIDVDFSHRACLDPMLLEQIAQCGATGFELDAVVPYTVGARVLACQDACARGAAKGVLAIRALKAHPLACEPVQMGRPANRVPIAAQRILAKLVR